MDYKKIIIDSGIKMLHGGFTVETWGNISCVDRKKNLVYLTPSGMDYENCSKEDIVVTDLSGKIVEGKRIPTIETMMHVNIYNNRPDVGVVVHTHPVYSTVFSCMGENIPLIIDEAAQVLGETIKTTEYALPGSKELADECIRVLGQKANACLLRSHGAVCVGDTMKSAFKVATVLELTAQVYMMIRSCGGRYVPISQENIEIMADFAKNKYGQRE